MFRQHRRYVIACATIEVLLLAASGLVGSARDAQPSPPDSAPPSLAFRGHRYGRYTPADGERASLRRGGEAGRLAFRWQSGGALPPGTPVYRVSGVSAIGDAVVSADQLIAVEVDRQLVFYHPYGPPDLDMDEIVIGTVARVEQVLCPASPCSGRGPIPQVTLAVADVWQSLPGFADPTIAILLGDGGTAPATGSTIVALVRRSAPIPALGTPQFFWLDPAFLYTVADGQLTPPEGVPTGEPRLTVEQARAAVREIFAGVCLTIPPTISSPAVHLPGTPFPTAIAPQRRC